jgi:AraC-like DNA-binding protein
MKYCEIAPPLLLAEHVECFWSLRSTGDATRLPPQRIFPDGCIELIVNLADPFAEPGPQGLVRQPLHFVVGQMQQPLEIVATGNVHLLGIRFHPTGARKILGIPMGALTGQIVPVDALHRELGAAVRQVCDVTDYRERWRIIESALRRMAAQGKPVDLIVWNTLTRLLATDGDVSVTQLTAAAGVSRRQLERKFDDWVGLAPKTLARILRFQRVFKAHENGAANWAEIAAECGYCDQSHLIRDFRQFAGGCPSALTISHDSLTELFMRKNRLTHSSKTLSQD